jgi:hypothetical protein
VVREEAPPVGDAASSSARRTTRTGHVTRGSRGRRSSRLSARDSSIAAPRVSVLISSIDAAASPSSSPATARCREHAPPGSL